MTQTENEALIARFTMQYEAERKIRKDLPELIELQEKYDLLDAIGRDKVFTLRPLSFAMWQMIRWLNGWTGMLHDIILPSSQNAIALEESSAFDDTERREVAAILNWLMYCNRRMNYVVFQPTEEKRMDETAKIIVAVHAEWQNFLPRMQKIVQKNMALWDNKMRSPEAKPNRMDYSS